MQQNLTIQNTVASNPVASVLTTFVFVNLCKQKNVRLKAKKKIDCVQH